MLVMLGIARVLDDMLTNVSANLLHSQVIARPPPDWEVEYHQWTRQRLWKQGRLRDYPDVVGTLTSFDQALHARTAGM
jgi:hypothetical protein